MKLHSFGINLDQGIPFETTEEFEKLYVPSHQEAFDKLVEWINNGQGPIIVSGQIGSGKSTLINKTILESKSINLMHFKFDSNVVDASLGGFLWHIIVQIGTYCKEKDFSLKDYTFLDDLIDKIQLSWEIILELDEKKFTSTRINDTVERIINKLVEKQMYCFFNIHKLLSDIQFKQERPVILLFAGIDKYEISSAGYYSLTEVIKKLRNFKILLEFNAIHFFDQNWSSIDKIFMGTFSSDNIKQIINKRMGSYSESVKNVIEDLNLFAGGNPRQALRLLSNYLANNKRGMETKIAFGRSVTQTVTDFFAYSERPTSELIRYLRINKQLMASNFGSTGDHITAQLALFGNWIFLTGKQTADSWDTIINPLVNIFYKDSFTSFDANVKKVFQIAHEQNISGDGLALPPNPSEASQDFFNVEKGLNINQAWDILAKSLLSARRSDRSIIVYRNPKIKEIAKPAIVLKAILNEIKLEDVVLIKDQSLLQKLLSITSSKFKPEYFYSIDICDRIPKLELSEIDKLRDALIPFKMLWWINAEYLEEYLQKWVQLRQLFNIIVLDDELEKLLNLEEVQEDIENYKLVKKKNKAIDESLKVLERFLGELYE
jgi:hypothetical protein